MKCTLCLKKMQSCNLDELQKLADVNGFRHTGFARF